MIKVGDYAKYKDDILVVKKTYLHSFVGLSLTHATEHILDYNNDVGWLIDYERYEQQKQRADRAEKRWSEFAKWIEEGILINCDKYDRTGATPYKMFIRVLEAAQKKMQQLEEESK